MTNSGIINQRTNLIHGDEKEITRNLNSPRKLLWIGAIEFLPIIAGVVLFKYCRPIIFHYDYILIGILVSIFIAYILRNKIPQQPIKIKDKNLPTGRQAKR